MFLTILNNRDSYEKMDKDPTGLCQKELFVILNQAKERRLIDENEYKFLAVKTPQIPTFHALPKVQKGVTPLKGQPIVAGIGAFHKM